mmetsp:Transcript_57287/g.153809  ORF Transcript_57287/g.153809 Transcript_57287/m.153809 type:complete len:84 (+) Transcript_57287:177-428(+)
MAEIASTRRTGDCMRGRLFSKRMCRHAKARSMSSLGLGMPRLTAQRLGCLDWCCPHSEGQRSECEWGGQACCVHAAEWLPHSA